MASTMLHGNVFHEFRRAPLTSTFIEIPDVEVQRGTAVKRSQSAPCYLTCKCEEVATDQGSPIGSLVAPPLLVLDSVCIAIEAPITDSGEAPITDYCSLPYLFLTKLEDKLESPKWSDLSPCSSPRQLPQRSSLTPNSTAPTQDTPVENGPQSLPKLRLESMLPTPTLKLENMLPAPNLQPALMASLPLQPPSSTLQVNGVCQRSTTCLSTAVPVGPVPPSFSQSSCRPQEVTPPAVALRPMPLAPGPTSLTPSSGRPTEPEASTEHEQQTWDEEESSFEEPVTTVMMRNLPTHVSQFSLVEKLNQSGFEGTYNFVYLPQSFKSNVNVGFCFINFCEPGTVGIFLSLWHQKRIFSVDRGQQALNIAPADVQGLEANIQQWATPRLRRIKNSLMRPLILDEHTKKLRSLTDEEFSTRGSFSMEAAGRRNETKYATQ